MQVCYGVAMTSFRTIIKRSIEQGIELTILRIKKRHSLRACLILLSLCCSQPALAMPDWFEYDWRLRKQHDDIQVLTAKVPGSPFLAVKSTMVVNSSMPQLLNLALDTDTFPLWVRYCVVARVLHRESETEFVQYTVSKPPWPLRKRDVVMLVNVQHQESGQVIVTGRAVESFLPEQPKHLRVKQINATWYFTPILNDSAAESGQAQIKIEHFLHADPAGVVPPWLSNKLMLDTPIKTLMNMRQQLQQKTIAE